ncbi:MAG: hypothetical protein AAGC55_24225, partial [Myxococcota bacterium]
MNDFSATLQVRRTAAGSPGDLELLRPGEMVGGTYRIRSVLGRGGMAQIFDAEDILLKRSVVLKVAWP